MIDQKDNKGHTEHVCKVINLQQWAEDKKQQEKERLRQSIIQQILDRGKKF